MQEDNDLHQYKCGRQDIQRPRCGSSGASRSSIFFGSISARMCALLYIDLCVVIEYSYYSTPANEPSHHSYIRDVARHREAAQTAVKKEEYWALVVRVRPAKTDQGLTVCPLVDADHDAQIILTNICCVTSSVTPTQHPAFLQNAKYHDGRKLSMRQHHLPHPHPTPAGPLHLPLPRMPETILVRLRHLRRLPHFHHRYVPFPPLLIPTRTVQYSTQFTCHIN